MRILTWKGEFQSPKRVSLFSHSNDAFMALEGDTQVSIPYTGLTVFPPRAEKFVARSIDTRLDPIASVRNPALLTFSANSSGTPHFFESVTRLIHNKLDCLSALPIVSPVFLTAAGYRYTPRLSLKQTCQQDS